MNAAWQACWPLDVAAPDTMVFTHGALMIQIHVTSERCIINATDSLACCYTGSTRHELQSNCCCWSSEMCIVHGTHSII